MKKIAALSITLLVSSICMQNIYGKGAIQNFFNGVKKRFTGTEMTRKAQYPVDDFIISRWSPRAMSGEAVSKKELMSLFEAARWAPSSYNNQPWRFIYVLRDTPEWNNLFDLLVDFNKGWAKNAGALVLVVSKDDFTHNGQYSRTHSFDTGAAWMNFALQGHENGLVVHGMEGLDYDKAQEDLDIPEGYTIEMMAAIGKPGSLDMIDAQMHGQEKPSDRKSVEEFAFEGRLK